jgi:hypothetical protein
MIGRRYVRLHTVYSTGPMQVTHTDSDWHGSWQDLEFGHMEPNQQTFGVFGKIRLALRYKADTNWLHSKEFVTIDGLNWTEYLHGQTGYRHPITFELVGVIPAIAPSQSPAIMLPAIEDADDIPPMPSRPVPTLPMIEDIIIEEPEAEWELVTPQ